MQIVNLHREKMLETARVMPQQGLVQALKIGNMDALSRKAPHIPPHVRQILQAAWLDGLIHTQAVYYAPYYAAAFLYTSTQRSEFLLDIFTIGSILILPFSLMAWLHRKQDWAFKKVTKLFSEPFIFVDNHRIYANFPELNLLEAQMEELETMRTKAEQTAVHISQLAQALKEKLILMGQSTQDSTLQDLENQLLIQNTLIDRTTTALAQVESKRQQCLRIRQELFDWVELDWMKQEASQLTGMETQEKIWRQAADMELIAHDLNLVLSGIHGELGEALTRWQTKNQVR